MQLDWLIIFHSPDMPVFTIEKIVGLMMVKDADFGNADVEYVFIVSICFKM